MSGDRLGRGMGYDGNLLKTYILHRQSLPLARQLLSIGQGDSELGAQTSWWRMPSAGATWSGSGERLEERWLIA